MKACPRFDYLGLIGNFRDVLYPYVVKNVSEFREEHFPLGHRMQLLFRKNQ